jgi:hypothetical protein
VGGRDAQSILVIDGPTWWSYDPIVGATTNEGDPSHLHGSSIEGPLLEPSVLLPASTLEPLGERTVAGRAGLAVRIRARPSLSGELPADLPAAGEPEVVVDRERAILLSIASLLDGEPFETTELVEVAFDEAFAPDTFAFEPPPGEVLRTRERRQGRRLPLHEVARRAPFALLAAPRVPVDWELQASLSPADARLETPASAHLFYVSGDGAVRIALHERAASPGAELRTPDGSEWAVADRGQRRLRFWESPDADSELPRVVHFEDEGTRVLLTSSDLELDRLIEFAAALSPASPEPA